MNPRLLGAVIACLACDPAALDPSLGQTTLATSTCPDASVCPDATVRPDVRHEGYSAHAQRSGMKIMSPLRLARVVRRSAANDAGVPFDDIEAVAESIATTRRVQLGGLDYDGVITRPTAVTPTMPMVMNAVSNELCAALIGSPWLSDETDPAVRDAFWRRVHGAAPDADAEAAMDAASVDAEALCHFVLLTRGSLLLY